MGETVEEIRVFISCPGDVGPEKNIVKSTCDSLNNEFRRIGKKIRFATLDWTSITGHFGPRPQDIINTEFSDYDIYIGILWMRFGTPPGATNPKSGIDYQSGTEEEFEIACSKRDDNPHLRMYLFVKDPKKTKGDKEIDELEKVKAFVERAKPLGMVNRIPKRKGDSKFTNQINSILLLYAHEIESKNLLTTKKDFVASVASAPTDKIEIKDFTKKAIDLKSYIPRKLSASEGKDSLLSIVYPEKHYLRDIITRNKRIVVVGSAGTGKSVELSHLALSLKHDGSSFYIPIYDRLNTYVDQKIEYFLPSGWDKVPPDLALVILDGLDEVQPAHFLTAVRRITEFAERYPDITMVISCRTNFYESPTSQSQGTLPGFLVYYINSIGYDDVKQYIKNRNPTVADDFFRETRLRNYDELLTHPFFIDILINEFLDTGSLNKSRAVMFKSFIEKRIQLDETHYATTLNIKDRKNEVIKILQRIALSMELLGRNYITHDELLALLDIAERVQLIKHCTAFNRNEIKGNETWSFEHNNIQEYLASSALVKLPLHKIKAIISINGKKIKPTWVNTLFFLASICSPQKRTPLLKWITEVEPEIMVKIEPDKVDSQTRLKLFKEIYNYYKERNIWLRSNKFNSRELVNFPNKKEVLAFLYEEIENPASTRTNALNAMSLLSQLNLDFGEKHRAANLLASLINSNIDDTHLIHSALYALTSLDITNESFVARLNKSLRHRNNQYIRAGMYSLIHHAGLVDEYLNYFIDGITLKNNDNDREDVNLGDEHMALKEALCSISTKSSVEKVLTRLEDLYSINYFDRDEVVKAALKTSSQIYSDEPDIFDVVISFLTKQQRATQENSLPQIVEFFQATKTDLIAFKKIWSKGKKYSFEEENVLGALLNEQIIDYILDEYRNHNLINEDIIRLYNARSLYIHNEQEEVLKYFRKKIEEKAPIIQLPDPEASTKFFRKKTQINFDIFFEPIVFKEELRRVFNELGKNEITRDELFELNRPSYNGSVQISLPLFQFIVMFCRNNETAHLETIVKFIDNTKNFDNYRFEMIYENLANKGGSLQINDNQVAQIENWVEEKVQVVNIRDTHRLNEHDPNISYTTKFVPILWFFIKKFKIEIPNEKLLDFTMFVDVRPNKENRKDLEYIHEKVGSRLIEGRIISNLQNGINYPPLWEQNALYAIKLRLKEVFPTILLGICDRTKRDHERREVLLAYHKATNDSETLVNLLPKLNTDAFRWLIVQQVKGTLREMKGLINYLLKVLKTRDESLNDRLLAAAYLTEFNQEKGFNFLSNHILEVASPDLDYLRYSSSLSKVTSVGFVPKLMQLLALGKQSNFQQDSFNRLDAAVLAGLSQIAMQLEGNLRIVTNAIRSFLSENKGKLDDINHLYTVIDNIENEFYIAKSKQYTILEAKEEIEKIGL